jgi:hypothetical protein
MGAVLELSVSAPRPPPMIVRSVRRAGTLVALAGAAVLLAAPSAFAAKEWSPPETISDTTEPVDFPQVAMNGRGHAVAVWTQKPPAANPDDPRIRMRAVRRRLGKGFGAPRTLGPAIETIGDNPPSLPRVAVDQQGNALAAWLIKDGEGNPRVVTSYQRRGRPWGEPQTISPPGQPAFEPDVAFDKQGNAVAVWDRFDGQVTRIQAAFKPVEESGFRATQTISPAGMAASVPQVGIGDLGDASAVWLAQDPHPPFEHVVQAAQAPAGDAFGVTQTISDPDVDADGPRLAVASNGAAMAAWEQQSPTAEAGEIGTSVRPFLAAFQRPVAIPPQSGMDPFQPRVGMDRNARATLVWREDPAGAQPGTNTVRGLRTDPEGALGGAQTIATDQDQILDPAIAVARAGNAVAVWNDQPMSTPFPLEFAARGRHASEFGAAGMLTPPGASAVGPALAANRRTALVVWEASTGGEGTAVRAQIYSRR